MTGWAKYRALQSQNPVCTAAEMKLLCPAASSGSSVVFRTFGKEGGKSNISQACHPHASAPTVPVGQRHRGLRHRHVPLTGGPGAPGMLLREALESVLRGPYVPEPAKACA